MTAERPMPRIGIHRGKHMRAVAEEKDKRPSGVQSGPVDMGAWVAANQPRLHPTRRKVLTVAAELTNSGSWATSSQIRAHTGLSQQLLNRHLRALQEKNLVELENPGPGLPLNIMITSGGLRALGMRGPKGEKSQHLKAGMDRAAPTANDLAGRVRSGEIGDDFLSTLTEMIYQSVQAKLSGLGVERLAAPPAPAPAPQAQAQAKPQPPTGEAPADSGPAPAKPEQAAQPAFQPTRDPGAPPELNSAESALERRLETAAHPEVRGLPWYQRTKQFQNVWDQLRRRHLGQLTTYFNSFGPRWQRLDWADFNLGRRQADAKGASYHDWILAQFERVSADGSQLARPAELHGQEAVKAYLDSQGMTQQEKKVSLGPPPYTPETFNLKNPEHAAYADQVLQDMAELGQSVYGDAREGPIKLLAQAVASGNFPKAALDLRPDWRERVLSSLRLGKQSSPEPVVSTNLGLII